MRYLLGSILYNGRYIAIVTVLFCLFWHSISLVQKYSESKSLVHTIYNQDLKLVENAVEVGDIIEIKKYLWRGKNDIVDYVVFKPNSSILKSLGAINVGEMANASKLFMNEIDLIWNGLSLGRLEYHINFYRLNWFIISENAFLYILFVLALTSSFIISGMGAIKSISRVEKHFKDVLEKWDNDDFNDVNQLVSKIKVESKKTRIIFYMIDMLDRIIEIFNKKRQLELNAQRNEITNQISKQVSHDIRSPLTSLETVVNLMSEEIEEGPRVLIRTAVQRINDIANDLGSKKGPEKKSESKKSYNEICLLPALVDSIVSEKRLEYRSRSNVEILSDLRYSYGLFSKLKPSVFKRALSNLINNSVQAFDKEVGGNVTVSMRGHNDTVVIKISDNGKGIPKKILEKLGVRGGTYGKEGGQGLGLYYSKSNIEEWGGTFQIESEVGKGTSVIITLNKESTPDWFVPEIFIDDETSVVVIDDDDSIHRVWDSRYELLEEMHNKLIHFSNSNDVSEFLANKNDINKKFLFLCDYEFLGDKRNGLNIIEENDIAKSSILVTSRYEEKEIREKCKQLGVKLLPKGLAGYVPINFENNSSTSSRKIKYDAVLIDDQSVVRETWQLVSKMKHKKMKSYAHPDHFFEEADRIEKNTNIYIDSHLSDNLKGELVAKKIKSMGFERIYLATGSDQGEFPAEMPWIDGIRDKICPFVNS